MARKGGAALNRKVGTRPPKKRVVVVAEGEKTEPQYLKLVNTRTGAALVELVVVDEPATTPKQLVERACEELKAARKEARKTRDPNAAIDEIWCVFDVDDHPYHKEARQQADDNGVFVIVSNPSFEIWFLLHFESCQGYLHRDEVTRKLKRYLPDYKKTIFSIEVFEGRYETARSRAQALTRKHDGDGTPFPDDNPSTNVWELIESLDSAY